MSEHCERTGSFRGHDGLNLFYRQYQAPNERARLVIAHGLGEHSGRYGNVVDRLLPGGFSIWSMDHRGHGRSGGRRGHVQSFEDYLLDLRSMIEKAREGLPEKRRVGLLGHSMGGLIALHLALEHPELMDAVIASSPALGMVVEVSPLKRILGSAMSVVWPSLGSGNGLDATKLSHAQDVVRAHQSDPLVHDRVTARWFVEFSSAIERVNQRAGALKVPVLLQVAGDDHLVDAQSSRCFFEALAPGDKTLRVYDGLYHEIYNEPDAQRGRTLGDLESWLEAHL